VAASFQTPTLITIAQDLTKMQIDTNVAEADIGKVKQGQDVEFGVDAYPGVIFKGRVSQVRNAPINVQNVITYNAVILVSNQELKLKPGMTANVSIIISSKKAILRIPNAALRFTMPDKDKDKSKKAQQKGQGQKVAGAWIIADGKPKRISVSAGVSDGSYTELLSGEIKDGQEVIVESLTKAKQKSGTTPRMF
ncbi:MAG: efflux RND transporter periplasmic adaptor subunit, partial [Thermodesulfovibrionales bacterium]|nr:efflux RND transporter periplasmic adaptor subunit [Thermodesulfovibrionales bacterium]